MINTDTMRFNENIVKTINDSKLPVCVVRLAMKDIIAQLEQAEAQAIQNELAEENTEDTQGDKDTTNEPAE